MSSNSLVLTASSSSDSQYFIVSSTSSPTHVDIFYSNVLLLCIASFLAIDLLRRLFGGKSLR